MRAKEESGKAGLKFNTQKAKSMTSNPITSQQIEEKKVEIVTDFIFLGSKITVDFIFLGSKITVDGQCSHEIKTLVPWNKNYDKPRQLIKKQRHHFADKGPYSQSYGFPVVMYGCELDHKEDWAPKNWCFQTVVLEKTPENPLDSKESNQTILREINPEHQLEGLLLKLKFQCFGHLMQTDDSLAKSLILGKIEGRRRRGHQRMRWLDSITN